jgi:hypothetical protein
MYCSIVRARIRAEGRSERNRAARSNGEDLDRARQHPAPAIDRLPRRRYCRMLRKRIYPYLSKAAVARRGSPNDH